MSGPRVRPSRGWGYTAAGWSAAFAAVHLFWALGGSVGLAESAGSRLASERPTWFVIGGLYGMAALLAAAAALGVVLAHGKLPGRLRLLPLLAAIVTAVLLLRAVVVEVLLLADVDYGNGAIGADQRWWTLVLWNPWFLLGGITFGMAAYRATRPSRSWGPTSL